MVTQYFISKPVNFNNDHLVGSVVSAEVNTDASNVITASDWNSLQGSDNASGWYPTIDIPDIGFTGIDYNTWSGGSTSYPYGMGLVTIRVTGIDGGTSTTISAINQSQLINNIWHSTASESVNGTDYDGSATGYTWDSGNFEVDTSVDGVSQSISYDQYSLTYYPHASQSAHDDSGLLTQSTTDLNNGNTANWYINGIQFGSQSGGSSGNEEYPTDYWSKTDFQSNRSTFKDDVIGVIDTNSSEILEFVVKNALTPEQVKRLHVQLSNEEIIS